MRVALLSPFCTESIPTFVRLTKTFVYVRESVLSFIVAVVVLEMKRNGRVTAPVFSYCSEVGGFIFRQGRRQHCCCRRHETYDQGGLTKRQALLLGIKTQTFPPLHSLYRHHQVVHLLSPDSEIDVGQHQRRGMGQRLKGTVVERAGQPKPPPPPPQRLLPYSNYNFSYLLLFH